MDTDEKVIERLKGLIESGEHLLSTKQRNEWFVFVDTQLAHQWATSSQSLLSRVFGRDSEYYRNFSEQVQEHIDPSNVESGQGILAAAKEDCEHGYLFRIRRLIEAEVFDDFLEQADHLLERVYYQAAAVVAGCVLEDGLRRLCVQASISLPDNPPLDRMNADLAKAGVYSKTVQKRITELAGLRNHAAHGEWDQFSKEDAEDMVRYVKRFMAEHFS